MAAELPLRGVRVVDQSDEKGELAARLLGDLGADVLHVEPPGGGVSRRLGPFVGTESLFFAVRNANKRGVILDLDVTEDAAELLRLLEGADIWIETTRPGYLASQGLGPAEVLESIPHLVIASLTDFGQTGPYRDYEATDPVMIAMSWMLFRAGVPELPPVLPPGSLAYDIAGISTAFAALAGYLQRLRTGTGQHIDVSVMEAVAQTTDWGVAGYSVIERLGTPYSEIRSGGGQIYPIVRCGDGFVRPATVSTSEWMKLRDWLGDPEALRDDRLLTAAGRVGLYAELIEPLLADWFQDRAMIEIAEEGQRRKVPVTPVLPPSDVLSAPHYQALGSFVQADVAPGASGPVASGFYVVDGAHVGFRTPAPALKISSRSEWSTDRRPRMADKPGLTSHQHAAPFSGVRVLDFGVAGAAPEIARLLGEYGADVIRVESARRPDVFRQMALSGISPMFASSNRTKRSFGVDFEHPTGVELIKRLVATANVVVENLAPGTLDRLGLGWEALTAVNRRLVMVSSQMMGSAGPWKEWRGYGANTQPLSGMTHLWSYPDSPEPVGSNVAFPDHVVGRLGAVAAAAYIAARDPEAAGCHIEIVQAEVALNLLADLFLKEGLEPGSVQPVGNRSERGAPSGIYPCRGEQRWCAITCRTDQEWRSLRRAMGEPAWAQDAALDTAEGRQAHCDDLDEQLSAWTAQRLDREVMHGLQALGIPCGAMLTMCDQTQDPHLRERGYLLHIEQPGVGPMLLEGAAFHSESMAGPITHPAPFLGQHTREIGSELLDLGNKELNELIADGVLMEWQDSQCTQGG
jgi:crotonobetainyl-CoA:carnitine CoA-transferase CaiB-like acyl-CoA transferase